jgi:hypothetical protein
MAVDNSVASAIFRSRALFRLFKLIILVRKLDEMEEVKKSKKRSEVNYTDYKSPLERTLEILTTLRE